METVIIGAGASGLSAAVSSARAGDDVTVYEHKESAANKILITGNGKCNFTNEDIKSSCFHSSTDDEGRIGRMLGAFGTDKCLRFFESIGIRHRVRKGCIYPYPDTAESVKSALLLELRRLNVKVIYDCGELKVTRDLFVNGRRYDRMIIACGSRVSPKTGSDGSGYEILKMLGVKLTDIYPALTPLIIKEDLTGLKGVRCDARLRLTDESGEVTEVSAGELQPYEGGLSGICAMDISGSACRIMGEGRKAYVETDFFPEMTDGEFMAELERRSAAFPDRNLSELMTGLFPKKLINYLAHPVDTRRADHIKDLCRNVKHHIYELSKDMTSDFGRAQTVAGGVPLTEIDDHCMLKEHNGIYVTGELLDADGICGGYNLHFAWMTGYLAGSRGIE